MNPKRHPEKAPDRRVIELFAGVGGFRIALENTGWHVVWSNQWEPGSGARSGLGATKQHASDCYVRHFGPRGHSCEDIAAVVKRAQQDPAVIPAHDLLVGGFPCQDYSVAKPLNAAHGIEGRKGVLWWEIEKILELKRPRFVLLENVDRLLKSPAHQRGRDFAIILSCLRRLGYSVEWRAVNAADYGYPQRRRRVFILARPSMIHDEDVPDVVFRSGILAGALPILPESYQQDLSLRPISDDPFAQSQTWVDGSFPNAGFMTADGKYFAARVEPRKPPPSRMRTLGDVLEDNGHRKSAHPIPEEYFLDPSRIGEGPKPARGTWRYLKEAKSEDRTKLVVGRDPFTYSYKEGGMVFPDPRDVASRTILTSEGGSSPSRSRHVVETPVEKPDDEPRLRRLIPEELERLNGFPAGWTRGMPPNQRAFMMGNAFVVPLVARLGRALDSAASDIFLWSG